MKTHSKILIFSIIMLFSTASFSQLQQGSEISFQVVQDGKLLLIGDNKGNVPVTWDLQFSLILKGTEGKFGHFRAGMKYEYADLDFRDFKRYGFMTGFTFTNLPVPFTDRAKWTLSPMIGTGFMSRNNNGLLWSHEFSLEFGLPVTDWLNLVVLSSFTERPDLLKYGDRYRFNLAAGFEIELSTDYQKRQAKKGTRFF